jgi:hypothetical protein
VAGLSFQRSDLARPMFRARGEFTQNLSCGTRVRRLRWFFSRELRGREDIMAKVEDDHIVETTQEARAGTSGQNVRYVLAFGTVGVAVLFVIVYLYYFV